MAYKLIGFAVKGVGSGLGLVSESIYHYKDKKRSKLEQTGEEANPEQEVEELNGEHPPQQQNDEEQWQLDEAQDELAVSGPDILLEEHEDGPPQTQIQQTKSYNKHNPKIVFERFIERFPIPNIPASAKLASPVIIPQRRPRDRTRGFIRAYAPVLQEVGIQQAEFIDFLETFNQANLASPFIQVLNLAGLVIGSVFNTWEIAVTTALQVAVYIFDEIQGRRRANRFLNQINETYFRPRGLYALVMVWRPDAAYESSASNFTEVDLTSTITSSMRGASSNPISRFQKSMKSSDGKTYGDNAYETFFVP